MDPIEDTSHRDLESLLQDGKPEDPEFAEFNPSDLLNSPLFQDSAGSSNSFEMQLEDMEPTPMAPSSCGSAYQRHQQLLPIPLQLHIHQQHQQQQQQLEQMEQQFKFANLKSTDQLFEPTPMRSKPEPQAEKDKRMVIDSQRFPGYCKKPPTSSKKAKQRRKPVPVSPSAPVPIAPMPPTGLPPESMSLTSQSAHGIMISPPMVLDRVRSFPGAAPSMPLHSVMQNSCDPYTVLAQQQQNIHVAAISASSGSFHPAYVQEPHAQSLQQFSRNNLQFYSEGMEKLCQSMKRTARSRSLVKRLSGRTPPGSSGGTLNSAPVQMARPPGSLKRYQCNEDNFDLEYTTPLHQTRKPSVHSKHRYIPSRGVGVSLPIDFHSEDEAALRETSTVYSADNLSVYSTDNSTVYSSYSGQTI